MADWKRETLRRKWSAIRKAHSLSLAADAHRDEGKR
jgi:hypothetical protein